MKSAKTNLEQWSQWNVSLNASNLSRTGDLRMKLVHFMTELHACLAWDSETVKGRSGESASTGDVLPQQNEPTNQQQISKYSLFDVL